MIIMTDDSTVVSFISSYIILHIVILVELLYLTNEIRRTFFIFWHVCYKSLIFDNRVRQFLFLSSGQ